STTQLQTVNVTRSAGAVTIELNRPQALNAWNEQFGIDLLAAVREAAADEAVRAVVITGAGRGFSSGADLKDTGAGQPRPAGRAPARGAGARVGPHQPRRARRSARAGGGGARGAARAGSHALLRGGQARAQQLALRAHARAARARGAAAAGNGGQRRFRRGR